MTCPFAAFLFSLETSLYPLARYRGSPGIVDPNSIIVIQGDHGINLRINVESGIFYIELIKDEETIKKYKKLIFERAQIFNLIVDDGRCNEKDKANTNSNTAVFVLNCLLGLNLKYEEKVHYVSYAIASENFGKVVRGF